MNKTYILRLQPCAFGIQGPIVSFIGFHLLPDSGATIYALDLAFCKESVYLHTYPCISGPGVLYGSLHPVLSTDKALKASMMVGWDAFTNSPSTKQFRTLTLARLLHPYLDLEMPYAYTHSKDRLLTPPYGTCKRLDDAMLRCEPQITFGLRDSLAAIEPRVTHGPHNTVVRFELF